MKKLTAEPVPDLLYMAVPDGELFAALDDGLSPTRLERSEKKARKRYAGSKPSIVTVLAWEAVALGHTFEPDGSGWRPTGDLPASLLECRDRKALKRLGVRRRQSCGGVIVSQLDEPRVLLLFKQKPDFTAWKVPKGGLEAGETRRVAARREVGEEAGIHDLEVIDKVGRIQYFKQGSKGRRREKTVDLYLMLSLGGEVGIAPRPGESFVACAWLPFHEAIGRVTQPQARGALARAEHMLTKRKAAKGAKSRPAAGSG